MLVIASLVSNNAVAHESHGLYTSFTEWFHAIVSLHHAYGGLLVLAVAVAAIGLVKTQAVQKLFIRSKSK